MKRPALAHWSVNVGAQLGVYQVVPRNSTDVSDYGINDTSSRNKDVVSVVTLTFAVS